MSRSRWGGFRRGWKRYREEWNNLRSEKAVTESVEAPTTIEEFNYKNAQGIWNLNSTVNFRGTPGAGGETGGETGGEAGGGGTSITFEGYASGAASNGLGYTISLQQLTGGGTAASGDLAILIIGFSSYSDGGRDQEVSSSGWTLLQGRLYNDAFRGSGARVYYKVLGTETSVSIASGVGRRAFNAASASHVLVFSGASTATDFNSGIDANHGSPQYGHNSYTGLTVGNFIIDWGASGGSFGSGSYTSNDYDTVGSLSRNDTADIITGFGVYEATTTRTSFSGTLSDNNDGDNCVYGQIIIS